MMSLARRPAVPRSRTSHPLSVQPFASAGSWAVRALASIALVAAATGVAYADDEDDSPGNRDTRCAGRETLRLENGRIHTMDARGSVVSTVLIRNGKFAAVGSAGAHSGSDDCTRSINLGGRMVIPGIVDNHNHIVLLGLRPGHDVRLENASSIAEALATLQAKASTLPAGQWVTSLGGFSRNQFVPPPGAPRFPTLAEIDSVVPNHPVLIYESFNGPSQTNSAGRAFFASQGVVVGADGSIASGTNSLLALNRLRRLDEANGQRIANQKRGTIDAMTYAASLGVTTHLDQGGFPAANNDADGLANFDRYRAFDAVQALWREGKLTNRIRINFLHLEDDPNTPELTARLLNNFPNHGDEWLKIHGIGEFTANNLFNTGAPQWKTATRKVANAWENKWSNENHSLSATDFKVIIDEWVQVNQELIASGIPDGITKRRWVVAHVPFITPDYVQKLKGIGGGLSVLGGWRYITGTASGNGPPFRMILDSGIPVGMSSDGMQISPMNPWLGIYYAVTGRNARGDLINNGQQITRAEALWLYTAANGWFLKEEDKLGSIEVGKYADLAVLSQDFFRVSDEAIKDIYSVMTVVNGKVVHDDLDNRKPKPWNRWWRQWRGFFR